jgi:hypothetical protein
MLKKTFYKSCADGDLENVKFLYETNSIVERIDKNNIERLLSNSEYSKKIKSRLLKASSIAVLNGRNPILKYLYEIGGFGKKDDFILSYAYEIDNMSIIKFLVDVVGMNTMFSYTKSVNKNRSLKTIRYLYGKGISFRNLIVYGNEIVLAYKRKQNDILNYFIKIIGISGGDVCLKNGLIHEACKHNDIDMIKWIVEYLDKNDISIDNYFPLRIAAKTRCRKILIFLLNRFEINGEEMAISGILQYAHRRGYLEISNYLIARFKNIFDYIYFRLIIAKRESNIGRILMISDLNKSHLKSLNIMNKFISACLNDNIENYLVEHDYYSRNEFEPIIILKYACELKDIDVIKYLIDKRYVTSNFVLKTIKDGSILTLLIGYVDGTKLNRRKLELSKM